MKTTVWINPRSKGTLGNSLAIEAGVSWLGRHAIEWNGANLDDRHPAFSRRYPHRVGSVTLGDGLGAKNELLKVFRRALQAAEPVHVIDSRAQADRLIIDALEGLQVLDLAEQLGVTMVCWIVPFDDDEHTQNLAELIDYADDRVRWLVVQNPTKAACRTYPGSGLQKALRKLGAQEVTMPGITPVTMLAVERHCLRLGRELPLAEAAQDEGISLIHRGELQWFLGDMFRQFDAIAEHLLPPAEAERILPEVVKPVTRKKKPRDLMADYGHEEGGW